MKGYINSNNRTSRNVSRKVKSVQPSLRTIGKWREEWASTGADHRMTFQDYKKGKCIQRARELYLKKLAKKKP